MAPIDASFRDRAVYFPAADALVLADLHAGRDASSDVELPLGERDDLVERLDALLAAFDPSSVVVAGDALHAFDRLPESAAATLRAVCERVGEAGADLTITPGNHDTMLETALEGAGGSDDEAAPAVTVEAEHPLPELDAAVLHGHERPDAAGERSSPSPVSENEDFRHDESASRSRTTSQAQQDDTALYVCGHDHPAIRIEGQRRPCYLYGSGVYRGADVLALPAFNRLAAGVVVNRARRGDLQSPLLVDPGDFRPVVRDDEAEETFWFPPLDEFRSML